MSNDKKFIADAMLGGLAKWLRIFGYDVIYNQSLHDRQLVDISYLNKRYLLTKDRKILERKKAIFTYLVKANNIKEQIIEVAKYFSLPIPYKFLSRCIRCNTILDKVCKEEVLHHIPPYVAKTQQHFLECPNCKRIYWSATHVEKMKKFTNEITELLTKN